MSDFDRLSWLLIAMWVVDIVATAVLVIKARQLRETALSERASMSVLLTVAATGIALLAALYLARVDVPAAANAPLLIGALIALSLPQPIWLVLFLLGRFQ